MPAGRPAYVKDDEKIRVLSGLNLYRRGKLKSRSDTVWKTAAGLLGEMSRIQNLRLNLKPRIYNPISLYMDVYTQKIHIHMPGPDEEVIGDEHVLEEVDEGESKGTVSDEPGEAHPHNHKDGEQKSKDKGDEQESEKDDDDEPEDANKDCDVGIGNDGHDDNWEDKETQGDQIKQNDMSQVMNMAAEEFSIKEAEVKKSQVDQSNIDETQDTEMQKGMYSKQHDEMIQVIDIVVENSGVKKSGIEESPDTKSEVGELDVKQSSVQVGQDEGMQDAETQIMKTVGKMSEVEDNSRTTNAIPPFKKQKLINSRHEDSELVSQIKTILAESPFPNSMDCQGHLHVFINTWPIDCLLQLLLTGATDYAQVYKMVMSRAKEEDFHIYLKTVLTEGFSEPSYAVRVSVLERLVPSYEIAGNRKIFNCSMHSGSAAKKLLMHYPSYNEERVCQDQKCGTREKRPVYVFSAYAVQVTRGDFPNLLGNELIPHIQGKSCIGCGGSVDIENQEIGDLIIFDLISDGNSVSQLQAIPNYIVNPLTDGNEKLHLLGAVRSYGSNARLRSSSDSFVHHTALAYRSTGHWVEYDNKKSGTGQLTKPHHTANIQLLIYARTDD